MRHAARQTPYETYCFRCRVTYPIERKRCINCGERLGIPSVMVEEGPLPASEEEELAAEEVAPRRGMRALVAILWLLLAVAAAIFRSCTDQN